MVRYLISLFIIATFVQALPILAAEASPYEAVVLEQGAEVRSGPGQRFYVTQQLEPGQHVEVYRRDPGDWLAIRPPEGSFSWIPQSEVEMTEVPGIAEVVSEEAKSWIGSRAERIRQHKSHIALARGERIEVLGKKQVPGDDGKSQLWMKIAPPAGEFRWVHIRQVRRLSSRELAAAKEDLQPVRKKHDDQPVAAAAVEEEIEPAKEAPRPRRSLIMLSDIREEEPERPAIRPVTYEEEVAKHPEPKKHPLSADGFVPRRRDPSAPPREPASPERTATLPSSRPPTASRRESAPALPSASVSPDDVAGELDELDVQLSLLLSREKSTWNFSELKDCVQRIVENASTAADRGQARFLLDKIKRFEETFDVETPPPGASAAQVAAKDYRPYDGEGWLTTVKSSDKPVAPYALVDKQGKRLCFVSPAPGLSVSSHLNKRVGLYGKRGLIPDMNVPHVLASKVIELDRLR